MPDLGWKPYPGAQLRVPAASLPDYNDPWQGAATNCSCIAGMSSLSWVYPQCINSNILVDFTVNFSGPARAIPQTNNLYQNAAGALKYGKSLTAGEYWPAFYEKAFGKLIQNITLKDTEPNMDGNWQNLSATAMARMTGWANSGAKAVADTILADLTNLCAPLESPAGGGTYSAQTKYPVIAWTANAAGLSDTAQIFKNHTYSILGLYKDAAGVSWVILRDPKTTDGGAKPAYALNLATWKVKYANYAQTNPRTPVPGTQGTRDIALTNYVFGLKVTSTNAADLTFRKLFSAYAYVS